MEKQYLVIKFYESIAPSANICLEEDLGSWLQMMAGSKVRIFEWDLNKLGLPEVEIKTEIRKIDKIEDTFTSTEDEETSDPDRIKYPK